MLIMNIEEIREYCLLKNQAEECLPFDDFSLVFKVKGKIFAILSLSEPFSIALKCDPIMAISLREKFPSVLPGFHMNKRHWNTVLLDGSIPDILIKYWIDLSYHLVISKLPLSSRNQL